jgi:large subunit ribosomal protein L10
VGAIDNPRPEKVAVVEEVRERLGQATAAFLTEYRGLKVDELAELRVSLRSAGGEYKIYKNTLVRLAVRDRGLSELEEVLVGPTAIAFVQGDAAPVAKVLRDYARTHPNLIVKGGVLGQRVLSSSDAGALADLPSREIMLARLAGALQAPVAQFAGLLAAVPRNFAYGLKALIDKKAVAGGSAGEAAPIPQTQEK